MRPSNDEGSQLFKFHFPCNKGERWIYILSLESATSIQKPRNLLKVAYHPASCLLHHYTHSLTESAVYKTAASQTPSQISNYYFGTCEKTLEERYNNHTVTFRNKSKQKSTELSKHIWEVKGNSIQHQISWDIASRARPYNGFRRKCDVWKRNWW